MKAERDPTPKSDGATRTVTIYRDDSTVQVVYERVKSVFWTAGSTVLVVSQFTNESTGAHRYVHWPRERFCWFKDEPTTTGHSPGHNSPGQPTSDPAGVNSSSCAKGDSNPHGVTH